MKSRFFLTESQRGIYLECLENPSSTMYNNPFVLHLPLQLDADRFARAVEKVAMCHPALFVSVRMDAGEPVMIPGSYGFKIERFSCTTKEAALHDFVRPFDFENEPLYRFRLCTTPEETLFILDIQHIVFDGVSFFILLKQITEAYSGKSIPDEQTSIFDVSKSEVGLTERQEYKEAQEFFRHRFEEVEFDSDIIPDVASSERTIAGDSLETHAPDELSFEAVGSFVKKTGITKSTLFMGAFAYALSIFANTKESCFTTVDSGRHNTSIPDAVGMFVRTLPLHFTIDDGCTVADFLHEIQDTLYQSIKHDCISFGELVNNYGVKSDIAFGYQPDVISDFKMDGHTVKVEIIVPDDCQSKMIFMLLKSTTGFMIHAIYRKSLYSKALMQSISDTIFRIAGQMLTCEHLKDIDLITDRQHNFIDAVNNTERAYDLNETVNSVFDRTVQKFQERNVLSCGDRRYTYREFDSITKKIALYIAARGIGTDEYVSVLAPRNDYAVIGAWGAIRSGAAFQMLDPTYPPERLNYMICDSKAKLLIADRALRPLLTDYKGDVLYTDEFSALPDAAGFHVSVKPDSAITLIYTSGTTGKPKGCILENRNLLAFCYNHVRTMNIDENSRCATYASFGFDAGIMDIVVTPMVGAELFIVPDEIRLDLPRIDEFYCKNKITYGMMTTQVGRMFAMQTECKTLKSFMVGGEKLVPFTPKKSFRFLNGYGPCETMAYISCHEVKDDSSIQPIGKPCINTKLYIIDKFGRMLPQGAPGELCIAGKQVGRGYLGLPEKTAATYVKNPFCNESCYDRIYKTGDVVRQLPDGNFEFIGRRDGQVKIRGFRVELTEIEEVIRRFAGIKDATVAAFDEPGAGKYVAAFVVSDTKVDIDALNAFILREKPSYMVPSVTMQLEAIPYTQNQKVNRRALPKPQHINMHKEPPATEVQKKIFCIVSEILGHEEFGVTTDLFAAGLTSIGTLKLNVELGKAFGAAVKISDIRDHSTIKALEQFFQDDRSEVSYKKQDSYPIMQNQLGLFLESDRNKDSIEYNIPMLFKLSASIDLDKLRSSIAKAMDAHPYIKATLASDSSGNINVMRNDDAPACVEVIDADKLPVCDELVKPFILIGKPLYRVNIFRTSDGNFLFMDIHHIISDGTSSAVLLNDINRVYAGEELEPETFGGFEAALEEEKLRSSGKLAASESYYENLLAGCNPDSIPNKCPENADVVGCRKLVRTFGSCSKTITGYCKIHNVTANAFFNAVFSYVLSEFMHSDDVTYCTVYNGRNDSRLASSFAMLVKTLPVRCMVDTEKRVSDFVNAMQNQLMDTMANDIVPFAELCNKYGLKSDLFFNYQGDSFIFDSIGGEKANLMELEVSDAKAPLAIEVFLEDGIYRAEVTYRTDCFCMEFASSLAASLETAAARFTDTDSLCKVSLFSEEEKKYFDAMNMTDAPFESVPSQVPFERVVAGHPDRIAVKTAEVSLTFGELDAKANAVANSLLKLGVQPDEIVGIILDRTELIPIAELGILKAGGAFLPMLPTYPKERIDYCTKDASCRFVLRESDLERMIAEGSKEAPEISISQNQLAYCIYTSGSTGLPKGVMIEHHSLANFIQTASVIDFESKGDTILCIASISFDLSITEILFSLSHGKTIYIATEEEIHNLDMLLSAFKNSSVDLVAMTPSFAWNLLSMKEFEKVFEHLDGIMLAAEAFPPALFGKLRKMNRDMVIMNGYGPTECTQGCSTKILTDGNNITIGRPVANMKFYVMDINGNLLPRYAVGELMVCGEGVFRGYVNLPDKNRAAFTEIYGERAYHSGDLVRMNRDDEVEFGGRADNQVKLRGFRIELDEVEAVIQEFPGVTQSKVIVRNNGTEDFLAAFFTATDKIDIDALTAFMRTKLTYYMIPAAMMQLDKMPMTPNGKLDKRALPEIHAIKKERKRRVPKKSLEEKILDMFSAALNVDECYVDDNFFEIGGTSLSASKVVMQLKSDGYKIEYQDIFDHQSAGELADYLESLTSEKVQTDVADKSISSVGQDDKIAELLKFNTMEYAPQVERKPLGDVLLTGAAGFLGSHIVKELLENETGRIFCIMRKGHYDDIETRLKAALVYYFENDFKEQFGSRIILRECDITDDNLCEQLKDIKFDTLINCAASVKHYANDNSIEFVNVHGTENLIALSKEKKACMIQISTTSVPGAHTDKTYSINLRMAENQLFVVDDMNNQYCQSKYHAELKMLEAIGDGMSGKIIRVGNLMGRYSDGEFQTNMHTNAFLNGMRGFANIGKCPLSHATDPMSFSPIDCTAKAVVLLSGTNGMFTAFNADSRSSFDEMKLVEALNRCGIKVKPVQDKEYYDDFYRMMGDPETNEKVSALLTNDRPDLHLVNTDNRFTADVLYRLGFSWPFIDDVYLDKVITSLDALDFFFMD